MFYRLAISLLKFCKYWMLKVRYNYKVIQQVYHNMESAKVKVTQFKCDLKGQKQVKE